MFGAIVICFILIFISTFADNSHGAPAGKLVFSFDDGPQHRTTPKILKLLDTYCIKARFYVMGSVLRNKKNRMWLREIVKRGHSLGNHLWSHQSPCKSLGQPPRGPLGPRKTLLELRMTERWVRRTLGPEAPTLRRYRPPHGHRCKAVDRIVRKAGYGIYMWHVSDYLISARLMWKKTLFYLKRRKKVVLLFHHRVDKLRDYLRLAEKGGMVRKCR
jgi:peptidoglycan/xylan/chitin deacetylase (PgdA/CDA1 family)